MSFLGKIFQPQASSGEDYRSVVERLIAAGAFGSSHSGVTVTPETALRCSVVYACVMNRAQDVAQLPLNLYRRTYKNGREGKEKAVSHPLFPLLHLRPHTRMSSMSFREMLTGHTDLRGNAYAYISRGSGGRVLELIPLHPDSVQVKCDNGVDAQYSMRVRGGDMRPVAPELMLHVMGPTLNGWSGVTPITYARNSIGLGLATEKYGSLYFKNGSKPGGVLTHPGKISKEASDRLTASFDERTSGDNIHSTMLLEEGMVWQSVGIANNDSQFLETRQFQVPEIARFFRMPLHKIQELSRATFSNIEQQAIEYVVDCLGPLLVRWEQALNIQLLTEKEQSEYFFKFNVDALLRGDIKSRYEAHSRGILAGFLNRNEVRDKEDYDAVDGLDEFLQPSNMFTAGFDPNGGANAQK